ncbi:hypothetical protein [Planomonospora parontospora]|uniref:hypothetical protein n=1 Tax=Planomonospora parontospora TaxID=58119 RepID=UPI001670BB84|nr:hypothetical protein [Planomonospora parontospora]GGL29197.1 hypothetical protein GCM10014719_33350 [Planomonospora parontospora subsp. antibiotica]GII19748.1 hypothetical protein Ppa05_64740 [Planomonospora parontospora subsp. antibiotica]
MITNRLTELRDIPAVGVELNEGHLLGISGGTLPTKATSVCGVWENTDDWWC